MEGRVGFLGIDAIKREARAVLLGKYSAPIGAYIIYSSLSLLVGMVTSDVTGSGTGEWVLISVLLSLIGSLVLFPLKAGELEIYLGLLCQGKASAFSILSSYRKKPDRPILIGVIDFLCYIPFGITSVIAVLSVTGEALADYYPVSFALMGVSFVVSLLLLIPISQSLYICIDYPDKSIGQILSMSREIMRDHVLDYIRLRLSFIPISILGILGLGLPFLMIRPYKQMSRTLFYLELVKSE